MGVPFGLAPLVSRSGRINGHGLGPVRAFNRYSGFAPKFPLAWAKPLRLTMDALYQLSYNGVYLSVINEQMGVYSNLRL